MNFLKKMIGSGMTSLPCTIGNEDDSYTGKSHWRLYNGTRKGDNEPVSVFVLDKSSMAPNLIEAGKHSFQSFPKFLHPHLLKYIDGAETETQIIYCTEPVVPLLTWVLKLETQSQENQIIWGMYCLFNALKFLHEDCKVSHCNISPNSIFVTKAGDWKLGGMDLIGGVSWNSSADPNHAQYFYRMEGCIPGLSDSRSPERQVQDWTTLDGGPIHAMDIWGCGKVLEAVYRVLNKEIPSKLERYRDSMLKHNPTGRAKATKFLEAKVFKTSMVNGLIFFSELSLKEPEEKVLMIKSLENEINTWPKQICVNKVLNALMDDIEFGLKEIATPQPGKPTTYAALISQLLPLVLKIAGMLDEDEFSKRMSPTIGALYTVSDRGVRVALLTTLESYADKLDNDIINGKIFQPLCMGFQDTAAGMREVTLKSMIHFLDKLSDKNLNDNLIKTLAKLQADPEPGIRTNVTILMGKLGPKLNAKTREKILLPAIVRGLRDPFPYARMASVKTLGVCALAYCEPQFMAVQLLPNLAGLLVDPTDIVRQEAFKVIDQLMVRIREFSAVLKQQEVEQQAKGEEQATLNGGNPPSSVLGSTEGWTSWALGKLASASSVSEKAASGGGEKAATGGSAPNSQKSASEPTDATKDNKVESRKATPAQEKSSLGVPVSPVNKAQMNLPDKPDPSTNSTSSHITPKKPTTGMKLAAATVIKPPSDTNATLIPKTNYDIDYDFPELEGLGEKDSFSTVSKETNPLKPADGLDTLQGTEKRIGELSYLRSSSNSGFRDSEESNFNILKPSTPNDPTKKKPDIKKLAAETSESFWDEF